MPVCGKAENGKFTVEAFDYGHIILKRKGTNLEIMIEEGPDGVTITPSGSDAKNRVSYLAGDVPKMVVLHTPFTRIRDKEVHR